MWEEITKPYPVSQYPLVKYFLLTCAVRSSKTVGMDILRQYLNSLSVDEQVAFAASVGTSVGYIRKAISVGHRFDANLVIAIERETAGKIRCEDLRPDVDWAVIRGTAAA